MASLRRAGSVAERLSRRTSLSRLSKFIVTYSDVGGVARELRVRLLRHDATGWVAGLQTLLKTVPHSASPAHWRWAFACMRSASDRGATGVLGQSELRRLLRCANASADLSPEVLQASLQAARADRDKIMPQWMLAERSKLIDAQVVTGLLLHLFTMTPELTAVFERYSVDGAMHRAEWLRFVRDEQLSSEAEQGLMAPVQQLGVEGSSELQQWQQMFENQTEEGGAGLQADKALHLLQLSLALLSPENDAVAPARPVGTTHDLDRPLSHYWTACSHNSYIIGDQLTGRSTADAYRRQLLQVSARALPRLGPMREAQTR